MNIEGETAMKGMDLGRNVELCCQSLRLKEDPELGSIAQRLMIIVDSIRVCMVYAGKIRKGWCFCV